MAVLSVEIARIFISAFVISTIGTSHFGYDVLLVESAKNKENPKDVYHQKEQTVPVDDLNTVSSSGLTSSSRQQSKLSGSENGHGDDKTSPNSSSFMFEWHASQWSECKYRDRSSCCDCYKHRNITCIFRETGGKVPPFYCRKVLPVTPHNEEKCAPCQQPCVMSLWGAWSECSATCSPAVRLRTRAVLLPASHGGEGCGDLLEVKACDKGKVPCRILDPRPQYKWHLLPWTSCRKPNNTRNCKQGLRTRLVQCLDKKDHLVSPLFCRHHLTELEPESSEPCDPPCDCRVTHWSPWGPCSATCRPQDSNENQGYQERTRIIRHQEKNGGLACPHLKETRECRNTGLPFCPRYDWHLKAWGKCYIPNYDGPNACGSGIRQRGVACILRGDQSKFAEEDDLCLKDSRASGNSSALVKPVEEESCKVACPSDCQLGEWQNWSACTHSCGTGGVRVRQKPIVMPASSGGEECGDRFETKPCDGVECQWWHIGQWTKCFLPTFGEGACGDGSRVRNVYCINSLDEVQPDANCSSQAKPPTQQSCRVPCTKECQVANWTPWTSCSVTCGAKGGIQKRTRYIMANSTDIQCLSKAELEQSRVCNRRPCRTYLWQTSPWSPCIRMDNATAPCGNGSGIQSRSVHCEMDPGYHVNETLCKTLDKPQVTRVCSAPCPEDCRLGEWSDWSACSHTCGYQSYKVRTRRILKLAMYGGTACPPQATDNGVILQKKRCKQVPDCYSQHWEASGWSPCLMETSCGYGGQERNISCVRSDGNRVDNDICFELTPGSPPRTHQSCFLPCPGDCELAPWTRWSTCSQTCGTSPGSKARTRYITKLDASLTPEVQCPHIEPLDLIETMDCGQQPCPDYTWVVGEWGSCIVHRQNAQDELLHCGHGIRRRHVICQRGDGIQVPHHYCDAVAMTPEKHQPCSIECPTDCQVSPWSEWDACPAKCGQGIKARRRKISIAPTAGGRPCPHLQENVTCSIRDCGKLEWKSAPWGPCRPFYDIICGRGERKRAVICRAGAEFEEDCERIEKRPLDTVPCDVPCLGDCAMSEWGEWTECSCRPNATKTRHRNVTKEPLPSAYQCEELTQAQPCYCPLYSIVMGPWTNCIFSSTRNHNKCGQGVRKRPHNCVREDGIKVDMSYCKDFKDQEPTEGNCELPCPVDCDVSKFTPWSHCSAKCGLEAYKERLRSVLTPANEFGRPCPSKERLIQNTTCHTTPCFEYSWHRGTWGECSIQQGNCGVDLRTRSVQCVRSDGMVADQSNCFNPDDPIQSLSDLDPFVRKEKDLEEEEMCGEPCPGDCVVSTWSRYGPCFKDCANPGAVSIQVRTRVVHTPATGGRPCPSTLMEVRPCRQDEVLCPTFYWNTGPWNRKGERKVHCMAHDHLEVSGGCQKDYEPSDIKQCLSNCGQYARCIDGSCSCIEGFSGNGLSCLPEYGCEDNNHCVVNSTYCDVLNKECLCAGGVLPNEVLMCPAFGVGASRGLFDHSLGYLILYIIIGSIVALVILALICTICIISRRKKKKAPPMDTYPNLTKIDNLDTMQKNNALKSNDQDVVIVHKYSTPSKNFKDDSTYDLSRYQANLKAYSDAFGRKKGSRNTYGLNENPDTKMCLLDPEEDMFGSHSDSSTKPLMDDPDYVPMFGAVTPDGSSASTNTTSPGTPNGTLPPHSYVHGGRIAHNTPILAPPQMGTRNKRVPPLPPPNHSGPRSGNPAINDKYFKDGFSSSRRNANRSGAHSDNEVSSRSLPRQHLRSKGNLTAPKGPDSNNLRTLPKPPKRVWFPQEGDEKPEIKSLPKSENTDHARNSLNDIPGQEASHNSNIQRVKPSNKPQLKPKPVMNGRLPQRPAVEGGNTPQIESNMNKGPPSALPNGSGPTKETSSVGNEKIPNGDSPSSTITNSSDDLNVVRSPRPMTPSGLRYPQPPPKIEEQNDPNEAGNRLMEYCDELLQELESMSKA